MGYIEFVQSQTTLHCHSEERKYFIFATWKSGKYYL